MAVKKLVTSPKVYVIMLIVATALLMFIGSISYRQIVRLGKSAESVSRIIQVDMHINQLFTTYSQIQATELRYRLLQDSTRISSHRVHLSKTMESIKTLEELTKGRPKQQNIIHEIRNWQDSLFISLNHLKNTPFSKSVISDKEKEKVQKVSSTMTQLNLLRNQLYREEQSELTKRKEEYASQINFTPLTTLFLGMFALFIFVVSFIQINYLRRKTATAEKFLNGILTESDNIISYLKPVYDSAGDIVDFRIAFTNEKIESILGKSPGQLANINLSDAVSINKENNVFKELIQVAKDGIPREFNAYFIHNGIKRWFKNTATLMDNGVLTTSTDTTAEKKFTRNLKQLNKKLAVQNKALIQTKAFLNNILESASNTVSHLDTVRDTDGNIIDFKYLFTTKETENLTGRSSTSIIGKSISEVFPFVRENGIFNLMVQCANDDSIKTHKAKYYFMGEWKWIHTTLNKLNTGITLTSYDCTDIVTSKQELLELNEQLTIQNSILKDAEAVAKIGSYHWDLATGKARMSDNFYRILECEMNEFEPSVENYRYFVHPKDFNYFIESLKSTIDKKHDGNFNYRIVTKSGKIKHLKHSGHFVQNEFVGVIKDITKELKDAQTLKEKNLELKRSNTELESFNRVASHDLQEPLRKIQIFISRITEESIRNSPEKAQEYLVKIGSSANRMQNLIRHLLAYSRLNKNQKDFSLIDLNEILENTLEDLETPIKEKRVNITVTNLPELRGVAFQLEQLFNNLLSNAIKYSSVLEPRKIEIDCQKIKRKHITDEFQKKSSQYFCITIKDNGIGFDQSNAKKIFGLFERLHQKQDYSGTGIGLAICKKIVENHGGHIMADGTLNEGAVFRIYLPA
ncbi:ATP-binding protein [Arenibacter certesii]|uniref:histidine kinase n=1 Tax=Arenibacter certesii TaxID=228955 RepID=A0A918IVX1_9FLAO|nr:ATP-binding protein [Arenibacter certesii]GGW34604.1 hypothetical protein GCM10007383_19540 [Arenibacter certesii]